MLNRELNTMTLTKAPSDTIAASYERVSTRNQGQYGYSLGAQRESLGEFAEANGWLLPERLRFRDGEDEDASGADWDLPGLTAMLEAAQRGEFSVLVVPDFDRFARSMTKGLVLEEQLKRYGVRVVFQRVPVEDSPEGKLLKNQLYSFAEFEREKIRLRSITGKRQKAKQGRVMGQNHPPYGYRFTVDGRGTVVGLEPDPDTVPIVKRIHQLIVHHSTTDVADQLNADGIPSPRGKLWSSHAVWLIATSRVYLGEWRWEDSDYGHTVEDEAERGGIVVTIPSLTDEEQWRRIQDGLSRRRWAGRRGRKLPEDDPFLLRSMLQCGHCHRSIHTKHIHEWRYYACQMHSPSSARRTGVEPCDLPYLLAEPLEADLWDILSETLLNEEYVRRGLSKGRQQHQQANQKRQHRLKSLDHEISKHTKRLDTLARRMATCDEDEVYQALERQARDMGQAVRRLKNERELLARDRVTDGLTDEDASALLNFVSEMRDVLETATLSERRKVYELLDVRGRVYKDRENGIRLGRKTWVRIEWQARLPLRNSENPMTANFDAE